MDHGSVRGLLSLSGEQTSAAAVDLTPSAGASMTSIDIVSPGRRRGLPPPLALLTDLDVPVSITALGRT